jgi:hypothetical protein
LENGKGKFGLLNSIESGSAVPKNVILSTVPGNPWKFRTRKFKGGIGMVQEKKEIDRGRRRTYHGGQNSMKEEK